VPSPVYDLTVLAPDHALFRGRVRSLVAPGSEGSFGILARHAPLVAQLGTGVLSVTGESGEATHFAVHSGFLEVQPDGVTILADTAEAAADIDVERARAAEERARKRIRAHQASIDLARAQAALQRALARIRTIEKTRAPR